MWGPGLPGRLDAVEDARAAAGLRRTTHADRIAARIAEFERCAADLAQRMGRPAGYVYAGGPVAWEPS